MTALHVEVVESVAGLTRLEAEWNALEAQASPRLPFNTWEWATCWWKHLAERRAQVRDELLVHVLRDGGGVLRALAPLMVTSHPGVGPARARCVQFFGADPNLTELRGLVCAPGWEAPALEAVLGSLERRPRAWDWLLWSGLPAGSPLEERLAAAGDVQGRREVPDFLLPLPASWEALRARLGRNLKESLRKCTNSLKRDGLEARLRVARTGAEVAPALEHFFDFHARRARLEDTVEHRDVFAREPARRFLREVCARFARRGVARVYQLEVAGKVVASRVGFALGQSLYLYYSGFDPAYGRYSVMTTALAEAVKDAIAEGLSVVNLSTGEDVSKTRWDPEVLRLVELPVVRPAAASRLKYQAWRGVREALRSPAVKRLTTRLRRSRR